MNVFSESRLEHEGARSAAQGQSWRNNPFLQAQNMPLATGEPLGVWCRQHDAWQRGFEGYFQLGPESAHRPGQRSGAPAVPTPPQPGPAPFQVSAALNELRSSSTEAAQDLELRLTLGVRRMGWRYEYRGYRYDRLADAVAYARMDREHLRGQAALEASPQADEPPPLPSSEDLTLMATWNILFGAGFYTFQQYRYERLCDALTYAKLLARRGTV